MASKKYFSSLDLNKNKIKNAVLQKTTSTEADQSQPKAGQVIFDTGSNVFKYYNGTVWQAPVSRFEGQILYKGVIAANAAAPTETPKNGDLYVFNTAGKATNYGDMEVSSGDYAIYDGANWKVVQGNVIEASTTTKGVVRFATSDDFEYTDDFENPVVISPKVLKTWEKNIGITRRSVYTLDIDNAGKVINNIITANNPVVDVYYQGQKIDLEISKANDTVIIKSDMPLNGVTVIITA